ncbi:hypothetical protein LH51_08295 [Nitrincola sp. A-D6]|nr:hypothetical protein LH51_08295 [Nitrincola sp. A-D6]
MDTNGEPFFIATAYEANVLSGLRWDGRSYSDEHSVSLEDIGDYELRITHYYGLATVTYDSIFDFAFHHVSRLEYLKISVVRYIEATHKYFFNKRKLVTKKRMELLEFMMNDQLDREHNGIGIIDLMTKLYSTNWVLHPSADEQQQKLELYLDSLVESGELNNLNHEYVVTGKAISTLERYEEEERRHSEAVKLQRKMVSLTILLVFMAMVQAGLIKLPPLLDFSSWGSSTDSHNNQIQPTQNPRG